MLHNVLLPSANQSYWWDRLCLSPPAIVLTKDDQQFHPAPLLLLYTLDDTLELREALVFGFIISLSPE
jgi:hypothetical protein